MPTATREPLPSPTVSLPHDEETHMDMSSLAHKQGQEQGGEQVPLQGEEQQSEPVQLEAMDLGLETPKELTKKEQ